MLVPNAALALCMLVFALVGCSSAESTDARAPEIADSVPQDTLITLARTACYGTCPAYQVSVGADGEVRFEGVAFVETEGVARGAVDPSIVAELVRAFDAADFASLPDSLAEGSTHCPVARTDSPTVTTSLRIGGREKRVVHDHGCQGFDRQSDLVALEQEIDRLLQTETWIGSRR